MAHLFDIWDLSWDEYGGWGLNILGLIGTMGFSLSLQPPSPSPSFPHPTQFLHRAGLGFVSTWQLQIDGFLFVCWGLKRQEVEAVSLETETVLLLAYFIIIHRSQSPPLLRGRGHRPHLLVVGMSKNLWASRPWLPSLGLNVFVKCQREVCGEGHLNRTRNFRCGSQPI